MTVVAAAAYADLLRDVTRVLEAGQARARRALERVRVRTYWQTGQVLHRYLPPDGDRAVNAHLLQRLAADLELSRSLLYGMLHFFRAFPLERDLHQYLDDLTWTHCRALLAVPDVEARQYYARQAREQGWSVRQLTARIRARAHLQLPAPEVRAAAEDLARGAPLQPKRGLLHTFRVVAAPDHLPEAGGLLIDLGFRIYLPGAPFGARLGLEPDPTARYFSIAEGDTYRLERTDDIRARHYSYKGLVQSVVDGDTLWVYVDCGYGVWVRQKVRLRGLDAPELRTAGGERARDFVAGRLAEVRAIALTTTRPDKYDRYLADIFYLPGEADPEAILRQGTFLNRQLLNEGLARRVTD